MSYHGSAYGTGGWDMGWLYEMRTSPRTHCGQMIRAQSKALPASPFWSPSKCLRRTDSAILFCTLNILTKNVSI